MDHRPPTKTRRLRGPLAAAIAGTALVLASAGAAHASGAEPTTVPLIEVTETADFVDPCSGATGTVTTTLNGVIHEVIRPVATFMQVNNVSGTFTLVPDDPTSPTSTGRFTSVSVGAGGANAAGGSILVARGTASDGTEFDLRFQLHLTQNGLGVIIVEFTKGCE